MDELTITEAESPKALRDFLGTRHLEETFTDTSGVYFKGAGVMNSLDGMFRHFQFRQDSMGIHIPRNYGDFSWPGSGYMSYTNHDRSASVSMILSSHSKAESVRMMEYMFCSRLTAFGLKPAPTLEIGESSLGRCYAGADCHELIWLWKNCVTSVSWSGVKEAAFKDFCSGIQRILNDATVPDIYSLIPSPLPFEPINAKLDEPFALDLKFYGNHTIQPWDLIMRINASDEWHKFNSDKHKVRFVLQSEKNTGWSGMVRNLAVSGPARSRFKGRLDGVVVSYLDRQSLLGTQLPLQINVI